jgi:hypothetical protein
MVVATLEEALYLARRGGSVVLIVDTGADPVCWQDIGPGRIAVFVGCPDDPTAWHRAEEMARELFGIERQ